MATNFATPFDPIFFAIVVNADVLMCRSVSVFGHATQYQVENFPIDAVKVHAQESIDALYQWHSSFPISIVGTFVPGE